MQRSQLQLNPSALQDKSNLSLHPIEYLKIRVKVKLENQYPIDYGLQTDI